MAANLGGSRRWSFGVYNTDLDPTRESAARIVRFVGNVFADAMR